MRALDPDAKTPLDWAAEYLGINRSWLDGVEDQPNLLEDHCKAPAGYRDWFANRLAVAPDVDRCFHVLKPHGQAIFPIGTGPLCLLYEESVDGLDASELSRYWLLSDEWSMHHVPCIENMLAAVAVAQSLDIRVRGRDVPAAVLADLVMGKKLIPEAMARARTVWFPEDLIHPFPGEDTEWRRAIWAGALHYLERDGLTGSGFQRAHT